MITPRAEHRATLLMDGRVLVTGGTNSFGTAEVLASAELFDPKTGNWSTAAAMHTARQGQIAVLLADGRVLVAGGSTRFNSSTYTGVGDPLKTAELYDPATNNWSWAAPMRVGTGGGTATLLRNGQVLIVGSGVAELYDPARDTWSPTGPMPSTRPGGTASLLSNGKVLVAPGYTQDGLPLAATGLYDPDSNTWTQAAPMNWGRTSVAAAAPLADGTVLVVGLSAAGVRVSTAELYDPTLNTWAAVASDVPGEDRVNFKAVVALRNGRGLAFTGGTSPEGPVRARLYNPASSAWSSLPGLIYPRSHGFTASVLADGRVLVAGGWLMDSYSRVTGGVAGAEIYTP